MAGTRWRSWGTVALAAVCTTACASPPSPPSARSRLIAELEELARDPVLRQAVLAAAVLVRGADLASLGRRYATDPEPTVQMSAYQLLLADPDSRERVVVEALESPNRLVRLAAAKDAATTDGVDDRILEAIRIETDARVFEELCCSYVSRNGVDGTWAVHDVVRFRSPEWQLAAVRALVIHPSEECHAIYRAAATGRYAQWGRRGLLAIGELDDEEHLALARRYGPEQMAFEYAASFDAAEADLGAPVRTTVGAMMRELAQADVVILGEGHGFPAGIGWQIVILDQLRQLWGPGAMQLIYESDEMQASLLAFARREGTRVATCEGEPEAPGQMHDSRGWVIEQRDELLREFCLAECLVPGRKTVIAYGAAHTRLLETALREAGANVRRVDLSVGPRVRARLMELEGTLDLQDKVFRLADGTHVLAAGAWGDPQCPQLGWALEARRGR